MDPSQDNCNRKRITTAQKSIIVSFMEKHPLFYNGRFTPFFTQTDRNRLWNELCQELNSNGGAIKSVERWKKSWIDWKSEVRKKCCELDKKFKETGDKESEACELTPLENRVFQLMGPEGVYGISGVAESVSAQNQDALMQLSSEEASARPTSPLSLRPPSPQPGTSQQNLDSPAGSQREKFKAPKKEDLKVKVRNRGLVIPAEKTQSLLDTQLEQVQNFSKLTKQLQIMNDINKELLEQQKQANVLRAEKSSIFEELVKVLRK